MSADGSTKGSNRLLSGNPASLWQESPACGALVVGERNRVVACTAEAAAHLRTKAEQLRNAPASSLPAPLPKLIRNAAKSGRPVSNVEIPLKIPHADSATLRASLLPIETREGARVIVVLNPAVSAPVFEQKLRRLDRLASLGTLSASMAHEIKNGMVAIKTFIDLLLQKGQDTELTEVVNRELQRINAIVTQMLRFASPKPAAFSTVHVHELLDHSLRLLHHQISAKLISLQRRYQARTDTVRADEVQLQQAFMNLLLNALEAMDTNGVLTIATEIAGGEPGAGRIHIHIQDTGVGVASENMGRLFEPFFTTKKNGTGLGLAISQRIAHEHRGAIQAQSKVNRGSTFSVSLPVLSS
jgi:signal transduction histidine kinase